MQINTNKSKDAATSPQKREVIGSAQCKELFASALSNDLLQNCQVSEEDGRGEPAMESSQVIKFASFTLCFHKPQSININIKKIKLGYLHWNFS